MTQWNEFSNTVGYHYDMFTGESYDRLVLRGAALYHEKPAYWQQTLIGGIDLIADWSKRVNKSRITTECWAVVDYKDYPPLEWDWVMELCTLGVERASASGRWSAISTSNFCGPQFVGMWRDIAWHQRLTEIIHKGAVPSPGTA